MVKGYIEYEDINYIKDSIVKMAEQNGYELTGNVEAIAKAKYRFFGVNDWRNCPCVKDGEHSCISKQCHIDIEKDGVCHCNLYKRKDK